MQSLAAGTANALSEEGEQDSGGSLGLLVAVLFIVGSALLFGKVIRGAMWVWVAAAVIAFAGESAKGKTRQRDEATRRQTVRLLHALLAEI